MDSFKTVHRVGSGEIIINKSKFIGHACPIESEEDALKFIEKNKKRYYNATHNVYAYVLGENSNIQRYSDDGEPSGTAGIPVLNVLKQENLRNVAVVVTRYFGGVKLGAGGLVRAYIKGSKVGLENAQIVDKILFQEINAEIDYTLLGKLENELTKNNYIIKQKIFEQKITLIILVENKDVHKLKNILNDLSNGKANITEGNTSYLSVKNGKLLD